MIMRILREKEVKEITGLSRVTRWRMERRGEFPARIRASKRAIGWREDEIQSWINSRQRVRSTPLIKAGGDWIDPKNVMVSRTASRSKQKIRK